MNNTIYHLLIPKENHVYCSPKSPIGNKNITTKVSKASCANCLSKFRGKRFRASWTSRETKYREVLPENL